MGAGGTRSSCGRFSPLRFDIKVLGQKTVERVETVWENGNRSTITKQVPIIDKVCVAWATEKETGEQIESPAVSIEMAVKEGRYTKNGSKWQTMDEVMLRYRTASFFGKLYAPELLMGLTSVEEVADIVDVHDDGSYLMNRATLDELRGSRTQPAEEVPRAATPTGNAAAAEPPADSEPPAREEAGAPPATDGQQGGFGFDVSGLVRGISEDIESAKTPEDLDLARSAITGVPDEAAKAELNALASARMRAISAAEQLADKPATTQSAPAARRTRGPISAE
ncbi:hypothetical protein LIG30_2094 [Burkholderia sp. lig30]|jgi:hypothetical protein|nr:hypothetical protein LIG30_2094 [Burkholderia sp. lig30]